MTPEKTALILIGYQNDYFAKNGILRGVLENQERTDDVLHRTIGLIAAIKKTKVVMIATPIIFSSDYSEVIQGGGILSVIRDVGAFKVGQTGSEMVKELAVFTDRIVEVSGKRGLNAFVETKLEDELTRRGIKDVIIAGAVTSICIDSTGRAAYELGFCVSILQDCTAARTDAEQEFFCNTIFPTYATLIDSESAIEKLTQATG